MGKIIGLSGGGMNTAAPIYEYGIAATGKAHPHVLFLPTAGGDSENWIIPYERYYTAHGCTFETLLLCGGTVDGAVTDAKFARADLIFVGGGDTENMLKIWKEQGVDRRMIEAYRGDKVLSGISAGTIFWFAAGHSDSDSFKNPGQWSFKFVAGLGVWPLRVCPHYNEPGRNSFDGMLEKTNDGLPGLALENDTAVIAENGRLRVMIAREGAHAYFFRRVNGAWLRTALGDGEELPL